MFTYGDILKCIPETKPRECTYYTWDFRREHCIQLQSYHRELEDLVSLTSNLKEIEDNEERKKLLDSLPPIPVLPKIINNPPKNNIINEMELSDGSIMSLLSKAAARVCFFVGYTDAPLHLLEELSQILKDYLKCLIFKCSVSGGPITLESLEEALQEFGINGIEELYDYYFNRILKFHHSLYSKCKELRKEFENNLKTPPHCPSTKHKCKKEKCNYENVEEKKDFKEEKYDEFSIETGETVEILYIKKQMKIYDLCKEENKSDVNKVKREIDISVTNQNPCDFDSKPLESIKEASSNFKSSENVKINQSPVKKKEFEESDKKLLDKYSAFFTFVPMTRKSELNEKSNVYSKKNIHENHLKKELNVYAEPCNSLGIEKNEAFLASKTQSIEKLENKEKHFPKTSKKLTNCKLREVLKLNTDDKDKYNSLIMNENSEGFSVSETQPMVSHVDKAKKLSETSEKLSNISDSVVSTMEKKDNDVLNKVFCKQENICKRNMSEEFRYTIFLKNNEILFPEQNAKFKKNVSSFNILKSCNSDEAADEKILSNTSSKISRTLYNFPSTDDNSTHHSTPQKIEQSLKSDLQETECKLKRLTSERKTSLKKKDSHNKNIFLNKTQEEIISESADSCLKNFKSSNLDLNKIPCYQSAMTSEKDLFLIKYGRDPVDNESTLSDSDDRSLDQSSSSTNDLNYNFKQQPAKRKCKLKENANSPENNSSKRKCVNIENDDDETFNCTSALNENFSQDLNLCVVDHNSNTGSFQKKCIKKQAKNCQTSTKKKKRRKSN